MKYKRNSGRKNKQKQQDKSITTQNDQDRSKSENELKTGRPTRKAQKEMMTAVEKQLEDDQKWIAELEQYDRFSYDWVHKVAVEILFQCMGKKEIVSGMKGQERVFRVFKAKPALDTLTMIAKMNGHLFDTIKGSLKQTGTVEHQHKHEIELQPDTNRTIEVFNILEACGALNPPKRLSKEDVEVISA